MRTSESIKAVSAALKLAIEGAGKPGKSGYNKSDKYHYSDLDDFLGAVTPAIAKAGLVMAGSVIECRDLPERVSDSGKHQYAVRVTMALRLTHPESGEWIEVQGFGDGQDRGDKGVYKATTGARKMAVSSLFNFGGMTSDEPEAGSPGKDDQGDGRPAQANGRPKAGGRQQARAQGGGSPPVESDLEAIKALAPRVAEIQSTSTQDLVSRWCQNLQVERLSLAKPNKLKTLRAECERAIREFDEAQQHQDQYP